MEVTMCPLSTGVTPSVPLSEALVIAFVLHDCRVLSCSGSLEVCWVGRAPSYSSVSSVCCCSFSLSLVHLSPV